MNGTVVIGNEYSLLITIRILLLGKAHAEERRKE